VFNKNGEPLILQSGAQKTVNKNYGVFGVKSLPVKMAEAADKFADWSDDRVREYRYSHGHCVATSY